MTSFRFEGNVLLQHTAIAKAGTPLHLLSGIIWIAYLLPLWLGKERISSRSAGRWMVAKELAWSDTA